ncbi:transmembrane protease serine 9-like [Paramacrobiotus metropolitanus]|uniref:transmembrane protease serine 9-like n=1 Tax=Paramacrobiotus metropolitanus TaxID=2943436 RepID=UPI002445C546|nr:transmembrane protease serine 9-like [Paramacrobiotus metropolitanus]
MTAINPFVFIALTLGTGATNGYEQAGSNPPIYGHSRQDYGPPYKVEESPAFLYNQYKQQYAPPYSTGGNNGILFQNNSRYSEYPASYHQKGINYLDSSGRDSRKYQTQPYQPEIPNYPKPAPSEVIGPRCFPDYPKKNAHIAGFCLARSAIDVCRKANLTISVSRDCNNFQYGDAVCCHAKQTSSCGRNDTLSATYLSSHSACVQEMQCGIANIDPKIFAPLEKPPKFPPRNRSRDSSQSAVQLFAKQQEAFKAYLSFLGGLSTVQGRIVGGFEAPNGSASLCWQVSVRVRSPNIDAGLCGGVIIGAQTIVTAAHCVTIPKNITADGGYNASDVTWTVNIGTQAVSSAPNRTYFYSSVVENCSREYAVREAIPHPDYDPQTFNHDVAVLILSEPIDFRLHSACACKMCLTPKIQQPGDRCVVSGFGMESMFDTNAAGNYTTPDPPRSYVPLKYVQQIIAPKEACLGVDSELQTDFGLVLCAGGVTGEGICFGESGGPLTCYDHKTGTQYLAGIVSALSGCGFGKPSLYSGVAPNLPWIFNTAPLGDVSIMI